MQRGDFYFNGPALLAYSDECQYQRRLAENLTARLQQARVSAAGADEWAYARLLRTARALSDYCAGMSRAALQTYEDADAAAREITRMLEEHQAAMRQLQMLAP